MHLIVPFAARRSEAGRHALPSLAAAALERLLARWAEVRRDEADDARPCRHRTSARWPPRSAGAAPTAACPGPRTRRRSDGIDGRRPGLGPADAGALARRQRRRAPGRPRRAGARRRRVARAVRRRAAAVRERGLRAGLGRGRCAGMPRTTSLQGLATASLDRVVGRNIDALAAAPARSHGRCGGCRTKCRCCCTATRSTTRARQPAAWP